MFNQRMRVGAIASVFGSVFGTIAIDSIINAPPSRADLRGNLTVEISGLNNQDGDVCLSLFNGSRGFPSDEQRALDAECVEISTLPVQVTFDNLIYGSYAIAAYHDKNQDAQLNQGLFGIPTEGFAFSNDAPAPTGPASFQDAVFFLSQQDTTIQIQMRYLSDR
ncbi:MAG: DUF2141 domain-containing protein [Merismopedia sp. SIO2A8]|nr:DUF2141 domain-containing protein [Merismopedia sp. SIO2A8]